MAAKSFMLGGEIEISRIGLGTNRIEDDPESRAILEAAVEHGVNFVDTADIYTGGTSERVIGATVADRAGVHVATKGGYHGAAPDVMAEAIDASLQRLRVQTIDLYYLHRPDSKHPIAQSVEPILRARDAGKVRHLGLSSVTVDQIQEIEKLSPVAAVQNRYNLDDTSHEDVIDYCESRGIAFVPFFPLRGAARTQAVAERVGATRQQTVLAAMLARSPVIVPIPGTRSVEHLESNVAALDIELGAADLRELGLRAG